MTTSVATRPGTASSSVNAARLPAQPVGSRAAAAAQSAPDRASEAHGEEAEPTSGVSRSEVPIALSDSEPPNSDETLVMSHSAFEGWYVRLDDTSQGPLDENELRAKVSAGTIDESTPVWRQGAQQWLPAGNYPGLLALVRARDASKAPAPSPEVNPAAATGEVEDTALSQSVPAPPRVASRSRQPVTSSMLPEAFSHLPGLPRRRMVPARHAWASTVTALGFGMALGYLVWGMDAPTPEPADAVAAAAAEEPGVGSSGDQQPAVEDTPAAAMAEAEAEAEPDTPAAQAKPQTRPAQASASKGSSASASDDPSSNSGGGLLAGLAGVAANGPRARGADNSSARGGEGLDAAAIQRTVQRYQPSVRRSCWQRALSSRSSMAPSSARVTVTIRVAASGKVTGVSHSGEPAGYPGLANCITSKVRGWSFPVAAGPTTANVPFVFAAQ